MPPRYFLLCNGVGQRMLAQEEVGKGWGAALEILWEWCWSKCTLLQRRMAHVQIRPVLPRAGGWVRSRKLHSQDMFSVAAAPVMSVLHSSAVMSLHSSYKSSEIHQTLMLRPQYMLHWFLISFHRFPVSLPKDGHRCGVLKVKQILSEMCTDQFKWICEKDAVLIEHKALKRGLL